MFRALPTGRHPWRHRNHMARKPDHPKVTRLHRHGADCAVTEYLLSSKYGLKVCCVKDVTAMMK
jgi:hypothetical protein